MAHRLISALLEFHRNEEGASAIEYALLASLIAAVIAAVVGLLGAQVKVAYCAFVTAIGSNCP